MSHNRTFNRQTPASCGARNHRHSKLQSLEIAAKKMRHCHQRTIKEVTTAAVILFLQTCQPTVARLQGGSRSSLFVSVAPQEALSSSEISRSVRFLSDDEHDFHVLTISKSFRVVFATILAIAVLIRLAIFATILRYRKRPTLQLTQSSVLAVLVLFGGISIASCYFLIPLNRTHCMLRDAFIFVPLTIAGNILAARVWRIRLLMAPVLQNGGNSLERHETTSKTIMHAIVELFTILADSSNAIRAVFLTGSDRRKMIRQRAAMRQTVPLYQLVWLICLLSAPQVILQSCKFSIRSLQEFVVWKSVYQTTAHLNISVQTCQSAAGHHWLTWLGVFLSALPYVLTALVSLHGKDLPKVFNETEPIMRSIRCFLLVLAIALPGLFMAITPEVKVYLATMVVSAVAMPPCWFVVYPKLWNQLIAEANDNGVETSKSMKRGSIIVRILRQGQSTSGPLAGNQQKTDMEKSAKLALTIGKMYEDMGLVQKSIVLFDEALAVWECDPKRHKKEKIGGFTQDEIDSFTCTDLEYIIQLLIAKGRVNGTFNSAVDTGQNNAAQSWLDALEIYERSPARTELNDRSIIFPIFSGLFVFIKGGKISQDEECNFEQNLVLKFVRETKLHGDPVHYTRALAMQCEVKGRLGHYKKALDTFAQLKEIYDPELHSDGVGAAYGTDRSAQAFSQAALWHLQLGHENRAMEACEVVLLDLLPVMDPKNVLNMCELLLPVIRIFKPLGECLKMRKLFDDHVVQNFLKHFGKDGVTPCLPIFKPLLMLLDMCHDPVGFPDFDEAVEWLLEPDSGVSPDFLDSVYVKLCWSPNDMVAELCLRVANRLIDSGGDCNKVRTLILKGLRHARKAHRKILNSEGKVILPVAYGMHKAPYEELQQHACAMGIFSGEAEDPSNQSGNRAGADATKHLPRDYVRSISSEENSSTAPSSESLTRGLSNQSTTQSQSQSQSKETVEILHSQRSSTIIESSDAEDGQMNPAEEKVL